MVPQTWSVCENLVIFWPYKWSLACVCSLMCLQMVPCVKFPVTLNSKMFFPYKFFHGTSSQVCLWIKPNLIKYFSTDILCLWQLRSNWLPLVASPKKPLCFAFRINRNVIFLLFLLWWTMRKCCQSRVQRRLMYCTFQTSNLYYRPECCLSLMNFGHKRPFQIS